MTAAVVHRLIVAWTVVQLVGLSLVVGYAAMRPAVRLLVEAMR